VRNVATLGGNLAAPFPEADLVPPLLAADAVVELATGDAIGIEDWVRGDRPAGALIVAARVPTPPGRRAWFERLTVRAGAEYSVASVAVSVDIEDGARVAVGAVEERPRRVPEAEAALVAGDDAGRAAANALTGRDGLDAPGWYRLEVLPALVARAVAAL
jgi:carbon-monoxide dehydrogenase medium subunit